MDKFIRFISFLVLIGAFAHAQVTISGPCPKVKGQEPFDINMYMGRWYEIKKYPAIFEEGGKCMYAEYSLMDDGKIQFTHWRKMIATNEPSSSGGTATMFAPGELELHYANATDLTVTPKYVVLGTDYEHYAVAYACYPTGTDSSKQMLWFFSREKNPSQEVHDKVDEILGYNLLSRSYLTVTDQENC